MCVRYKATKLNINSGNRKATAGMGQVRNDVKYVRFFVNETICGVHAADLD